MVGIACIIIDEDDADLPTIAKLCMPKGCRDLM